MKSFYTYTFYAVVFLLLQGSSACEGPSIFSNTTPHPKEDFFKTRASKRKSNVAAEAYYYRTLASCVKGATTLHKEALLKAADQPVRLVLLYDANAPWASAVNKDSLQQLGHGTLHATLDAYQLQIAQQFMIDEKNKGWVLHPKVPLEDPVEPARLLSLVEYVLMVNVKEVPAIEAMVKHK